MTDPTDQVLIKVLAERIARLEGAMGTVTRAVTAIVVSVDDTAGTAIVTVGGVQATIHLPAGYRPKPGDVIQIQWSGGDLIVPPLTAGSVAKAGLDPSVNADIAQAIADSSSAAATADGKVTAWYAATAPTDPAVQLGDLWVDTSTGATAGHVSQWSGTAWVAVTSAAVVTALDAAIGAQATADGKIVSFWQGSVPSGASVGDIWYNTADNNHPYRWSGSGWQDLRDGLIAQAIADSSSAAATADGKVTAWYAATAPTDPAVQLGDLWVDTSTGATAGHVSQWSGTAWVAVTSAAVVTALDAAIGAQATADGKIVSFWQGSVPSGASFGDIWYNTADNNHPYRWSGSGWQDLRDGLIVQAIADSSSAAATADGKNTIHYSTSGPSGSGTVSGDLWFQTSSGVVTGQWLWNGSSWVSQTLTNVTVTTLDAGAITSGTLSAIAIDGVTITGSVFKTAASGQRIEIQPAYNDPIFGTEAALLFYSAAGALASIAVQASSGQLVITGVGGASAIVFSGSDIEMSAGTFRNLGKSTLGANAPAVTMATFTGNLNSSGNALFSHGLSNPTFYMTSALVQVSGVWGDGYHFSFGSAYNSSGITINGSGLVANAPYRVTVLYG